MKLVLLRHAIAEPHSGTPDAERAITPAGRKKAADVCRALAHWEPEISHIVSSPLRRAAETAELLRGALGLPESAVTTLPELLPEARPAALVEPLRTLAASTVALVGHEPHLSAFAAWCLGGGRLDLRKAGVVVLEGAGLPGPNTGTLVAMVAPRHVRAVQDADG